MTLEGWGWTDEWRARLEALSVEAPCEPARVIGQDRDRWSIGTRASGAVSARVASGRLDSYPVVGDWVVACPGPTASDPWSLVAVLPRRTAFARAAAGTGAAAQVLAANVDRVWIVHGLDVPPNLRRLERYLALAWESGAAPSVVLTKADLADDLAGCVAEVSRIAIGIPVHSVSTEDVESVRALRATLAPGETVVLLGPSGAGKSTLLNLLAEASVSATGAVRPSDRKGRHTTTRRALFQLEGGALVLDTPGLRELRVWDLDEGLDRAFPDIEQLARGCRFRDCRHEREPECAVLAAVAAGDLDSDRLASFRKLRAEAAHEARKADPRARAAALAEHKTALKTLKHHLKFRGPE
ncbi:MAG: ribosome small subunit-dependent GTPase A [Gemmatimonadales bacterium]